MKALVSSSLKQRGGTRRCASRISYPTNGPPFRLEYFISFVLKCFVFCFFFLHFNTEIGLYFTIDNIFQLSPFFFTFMLSLKLRSLIIDYVG